MPTTPSISTSALIAFGLAFGLALPPRASAQLEAAAADKTETTEKAAKAKAGKADGYETPPPRARKLFEEARDMLEKGRYDYAAQGFRKALVILDDPRVYLYGRAAVLSELYNAQLGAYNLDGDPIHLCELKETLGDYTRALVDTFKDEAEELPELKRAREHQDKITQLLVDHVANSDEIKTLAEVCPERALGNGPAPEPGDPGAEQPAPTPASVALINPDAPPPIPLEPTPKSGAPKPEGPSAPGIAINSDQPVDPMPLFVAGGVTTTVGVALLVTMVYGFVEMDRAEERAKVIYEPYKGTMDQIPKAELDEINELQRDFQSFRTLGVTTAVFGALAFGGGIAMLAVGKQQRDAARYRGMALSPYGGRRGAGLQFRMRF